MANERRQRLEAALQNPNVKIMLETIKAAEGIKHGYNTGFGNTIIESLADHPRERKPFKTTKGETKHTTAAGAYQFLEGTWDEEAKALDLVDFGQHAQDLAALSRIEKRGALDDVLAGNFQAAVQKLGTEWASLPSSNYDQNKRSWDYTNSLIAQLGGNIMPTTDTRINEPEAPPTTLTTNAADDMVAGAFDAFAASRAPMNPDVLANPFEAFVDEQRQAQEEQLVDDYMQSQNNMSRINAVAAFFNEEPMAADVRLPKQIESAIQRELSRIG